MNTTPITKLRHLKDFLNLMTNEELQQDVILWGEEIGGKVTGAFFLEEDYVNPSGESCEPISVYKEDPEFVVEQEPIVLKKGTIIFNVEMSR